MSDRSANCALSYLIILIFHILHLIQAHTIHLMFLPPVLQLQDGKEAIEKKPGDCINITPEVKHWHGAAPDSWFSHLAVEVPGEETSNEWCEPVSDEEYGKLK